MAILKRERGEELEARATAFLEDTACPSPPRSLEEYGLQRVLARAERLETEKRAHSFRRTYRNPALLHRVAVVVLAVFVILVISTTGTYAASYNAQPDSPLYSAKIFFERARITLNTSAIEDIELEMDFSGRRIKELEKMVNSGNQRGADRWLREYLRNIEGAGSLFDSLRPEDVEELALRFQGILDDQAYLMEGMRQGQPPDLAEKIESAYKACHEEGSRMRRRSGQENNPESSQQGPGAQQQEGNRSPTGDSPSQDKPSSPAGTDMMDGDIPMESSPYSTESTPTDDAANNENRQGTDNSGNTDQGPRHQIIR